MFGGGATQALNDGSYANIPLKLDLELTNDTQNNNLNSKYIPAHLYYIITIPPSCDNQILLLLLMWEPFSVPYARVA